MGLLSSLQKMRLGLKGITPNIGLGATTASKLHNTSSVNSKPPLVKGKPSELDLEAKTPDQYLDNLPI